MSEGKRQFEVTINKLLGGGGKSIYNMFAGDNVVDEIEQLEILRRMSVQDYPGDKFVCTVGKLGSNSDNVPIVFEQLERLSKERTDMSD
jgi:hypothetical protein